MRERVPAHLWPALAFAAVLALAILIVVSQPVRSPWWTYADADASYTGSALNLLLGRPVTFVDHPGLPLTEAAAVAFGVDAALEGGSLDDDARRSYVDEHLRDLDRTRGTFRGLAIAIYLLGAALAFLLSQRLFGHWTWGLAGGLLWAAAPGLAAMSIQLRPDVLLAVLALVFAYLIGRAPETRSAPTYGAAAFTVGFAVMVKVHALTLLAPLVLASLWRPPVRVDVGTARDFGRRSVRVIVPGALAWLLLAVLLNWNTFPFTPTGAQLRALAVILVAGGGYTAVAYAAGRAPGSVGALFARLPAFVVLAFVAGLLLPVTLSLDDGLRALVYLGRNLRGEGVQSGIEPFSTPLSALEDIVGVRILVFFAIGALAGAVGLVRRDPRPVVWSVGALAAATFAYARPPNVHYFAPAFALCIPAVLWLLQREPRTRASILVWPIVLYLVWPAYDGRRRPAAETERFAELVVPAKSYVEARLRTGEVALVPSNWPFADSRYFELVRVYVGDEPEIPYRYLPTTASAASFMGEHALRPRYFIGQEVADLGGTRAVQLGEAGTYSIRPVTGQRLVAEVVAGPGVDRSPP